MRIRILGPVEIQDDARGRRLAVSGVQRPALLATLVVRAGRTVSTDKLIQELWGADPPANAANALQAHIKRLRRLIGSACGEPDRIRTRTPGYTLHLAPGETDAEEFTTRVTEARALTALTPDRAIPLLRAALALWRGPALDGWAQATSAAPKPPSWRKTGSPPWKPSTTRPSAPTATARSSVSSKKPPPPTRSANASTTNSCSRSTAATANPKPSASTTASAAACSPTSAPNPAPPSAPPSKPSSPSPHTSSPNPAPTP